MVPTALWLSVSGPLNAALPLPLGETFALDGVPPGTYTLSLVAANASGVSEPSNAISLSFPGTCTGPPRAPTKFTSWREGATMVVSWQPPESGPAVSSYTVSLSGALVATFETTAHSVSGPLGPGEYAISVTAVNACGRGPAVPAAPQWTTVVSAGASHVVHWSPTSGSTGYRVVLGDVTPGSRRADAGGGVCRRDRVSAGAAGQRPQRAEGTTGSTGFTGPRTAPAGRWRCRRRSPFSS